MVRSVMRCWIVGMAVSLAACAQAGDDGTNEGARATQLADAYLEGFFDAFPHQATLLGVADASHDRLPDHGLAALAAWQAREDDFLAALRELDASAFEGTPEAVTYGFLQNQLETAVGFRACRMELWNVSPTWTGWQSEMSLLANSQPVATDEYRAATLRRFGQLAEYVSAEIENLREGIRLGYSAPATNVQAVIGQMDALLAAPVEDSPYVAMAKDGMNEFRADLEALETGSIRPVIRRYQDYLRDEYLPAAREAVGVSANPDGATCYQAAIRYHATVGMAPEQVHGIGLSEMEKIHEEMRAIGQQSLGTTDLAALLTALKEDPRYLMSGRTELQQFAQDAVDRAREAIPAWFGTVPSAQLVVQPVASFEEASAPAGFYSGGSEDGTRPGTYFINLYQADQQPRAGIESVAFHESYPGHHLQGATALERDGLHAISRYMYLSGFGEGWGLYAERLADEMGLFSSDVDRMGLLSAEAHRAGRLVVDTGLHALGWSRQRAIDYLLANTALSSVIAGAEIDRYIAVPGQATSYMLGNLEIRRLRALAQQQLGDAFDIRAFHDRVLEDGSVPLSMLAGKIERWVETENAR